MKLDGITGASEFVKEPGAVECLGWTHSFTQGTSISRSGGISGSVGRADHTDIKITKQVDQTTRDLLKKCWEGLQIPTVTISSYNADVKYLEIHMENVIVSNIKMEETAGDDIAQEEVHLNYGKIKYTYTPVDITGVAQGGIPVERNLETGVIS
jgi:type VI secretion system secreted protein Hcp